MADVRKAVQQVTRGGLAATYTTPTTTDVYLINNDGRVMIHVLKTGAGSCTVTLNTGATYGGLAIANPTVTVPATTGDVMIGPFPPGIFNDPGTSDMRVSFGEVTGLTFAAVKV